MSFSQGLTSANLAAWGGAVQNPNVSCISFQISLGKWGQEQSCWDQGELFITVNRQDKVTDFLLQALHCICHASLVPRLWIRTFAYISVVFFFHIPSTG